MSSGEFRYETSINLNEAVNEVVKLIQRRIDEAALDKIATELESFGYVKVVRCRDCMRWSRGRCYKNSYDQMTDDGDVFVRGAVNMDGDGYCSLGVPRDANEQRE